MNLHAALLLAASLALLGPAPARAAAGSIPFYPSLSPEMSREIDDLDGIPEGKRTPEQESRYDYLVNLAKADLAAADSQERDARRAAADQQLHQQAEGCANCALVPGGEPGTESVLIRAVPNGVGGFSYEVGDGKTFRAMSEEGVAGMLRAAGHDPKAAMSGLGEELAANRKSGPAGEPAGERDGAREDTAGPGGLLERRDGGEGGDGRRETPGGAAYESHVDNMCDFGQCVALSGPAAGAGGGATGSNGSAAQMIRQATDAMLDDRMEATNTFETLAAGAKRADSVRRGGAKALVESALAPLHDEVPVVAPFSACEKGRNCK